MKDEVDSILDERGKRYGSFMGHATVSQDIQAIIREGFYNNVNVDSIDDIDEDMAEALFMIAHKIGRIVNGDPWYADSWIDIAGYAKLVADRLENNIER